MSILGDLYRRAVIGSWQTPENTRSFGSDTNRRTFRIKLGRGMNGRKHPGDPCPCGRGTVYRARSPIHGDFLGCSAFRPMGAGAPGPSTAGDCRKLSNRCRRVQWVIKPALGDLQVRKTRGPFR
jgi:hypothetical protein